MCWLHFRIVPLSEEQVNEAGAISKYVGAEDPFIGSHIAEKDRMNAIRWPAISSATPEQIPHPFA